MKALFLTVCLQIITFSANAVYMPSWDRPIAQSDEIEIVHASGVFSNIQDLLITLVSNDEDQQMKLELIIDNEPLMFELQSQGKDGCNSEVFLATQIIKDTGDQVSLNFVDHSARICEDIRPHLWEISLALIDGETHLSKGQLQVGTNPITIYTIQAQLPVQPVADKIATSTVALETPKAAMPKNVNKTQVSPKLGSHLTIYKVYK
ncbi:MAG: hypothetical protein KDD40_00045 [Bdellovibrionales bacterium]|nr:hypothetical protein [Bdellovibrionales bacterium]